MKTLVFLVTSVFVLTNSLPASAPELSTADRVAVVCAAQVLDAAQAAIRASETAYEVASESDNMGESERYLMVASGTLGAWIVVYSLSEGLRSSLKRLRDDMDEDIYDTVNQILREVSSIARSMPPEDKSIRGINRANKAAATKIKELGSKLNGLVDSDSGISSNRSRSL